MDTNVFVAAFAAHGVCEAVVELCLDRYEMGVSEALLAEVRRNLIRKIKLPANEADSFVSFVRSSAQLVVPTELDASACRDADDLKILGTAVSFGADYLVTGDQDMLVLERIGETRIVTPGVFARLQSEGPAEHRTRRSR